MSGRRGGLAASSSWGTGLRWVDRRVGDVVLFAGERVFLVSLLGDAFCFFSFPWVIDLGSSFGNSAEKHRGSVLGCVLFVVDIEETLVDFLSGSGVAAFIARIASPKDFLRPRVPRTSFLALDF